MPLRVRRAAAIPAPAPVTPVATPSVPASRSPFGALRAPFAPTRRAPRAAPAKLFTGPSLPPGASIVPAHDLDAVYARIATLADTDGVTVQTLGSVDNQPIHAIHLPASPTAKAPLKVVVTAGLHGNEPCGQGVAFLLIDQILAQPELRDKIDLTVIPNINPRGYVEGSRRTPEDVDLNRKFFEDDAPVEIELVREYLSARPVDLALDLHSGKSTRNGFWALHRDSRALLTPVFERFGKRWPVLSGDTKPYKMQSPGVGVSSNKTTLKDYMKTIGARWSITLEAPGSLGYGEQVLGQNDLVRETITEAVGRPRKRPRTLLGALN